MTNLDVLNRLVLLYQEVFAHNGFGEIRVEVRILKKGQKEVILHCGKQYRFVVDYSDSKPLQWGVWKVVQNPGASSIEHEAGDSGQRNLIKSDRDEPGDVDH